MMLNILAAVVVFGFFMFAAKAAENGGVRTSGVIALVVVGIAVAGFTALGRDGGDQA